MQQLKKAITTTIPYTCFLLVYIVNYVCTVYIIETTFRMEKFFKATLFVEQHITGGHELN